MAQNSVQLSVNAWFAKFSLVSLLALALVRQVNCAELPAGKIVWWGNDVFWKQIISSHTNGVIECENEIASDVIAIAARGGSGVAVRKNGTAFSFGIGSIGPNIVPAGLTNVVSVAIEGDSFWAIRKDGTVVRWSSSPYTAGTNIVAGLSNIASIACAGFQSYLALQSDGTVLGFRTDDPVVRAVKVHGQILSNVVALASTALDPIVNPLVVKRDGSVFSLGDREPDGTGPEIPYKYSSSDPVTVGGEILTNVAALAIGGGHALALKRNGTVVAWGRNDYGETNVPAGLADVTAISAGEHQSLALKHDGTVVAWGDNHFGQASVPAGLSNVVAIAAGWQFGLALTTASVPSSVYIIPHGRLEEMEREADLVFKGQVISDRAITNAAFPSWGKPHTTEFKVISTFKGDIHAGVVTYLHITGEPMAWSGGRPPQAEVFDVGKSYLIFAAKADKPDYLYSPASNSIVKPDEFRQLMKGEVPIRTLDDRPLDISSVKEAHWFELNLLLNDSNPTNKLYAIDHLDHMSLAGRHDDRWSRSDDFKRKTVLETLLPLVTNANEAVARRAISCFAMESNVETRLEPFAETLVQVANHGTSTGLRIEAIAALSGTHFAAVSNSLTQLLQNSRGNVRSRAVALLEFFPGDFSEKALRKCAQDESPKVRAGVADVTGNGKLERLLPTLTKLFADPVGREKPVAPLTIEELEGGGHIVGTEGGVTMVDDPNYPGANVGDVHTSAGYALLKFDVSQVGEILKTNLNDPGFRLQFLCKLAENNPKPWINDMVQTMEARRRRIQNKAETSGVEPRASYFAALMTLSGSYFTCWKIIYNYLHELPAADFANGKLDRYLDMLENAGTTGSQEPTSLYELYRAKGLNERAAKYRAHCEKTSSYDMGIYFNRVDAQFTSSPAPK